MKRSVYTRQVIEEFPFQEIRMGILSWWERKEQRHFPWRETCDPFKVLVAEILLHRTRADQVVPLYELFLKKYPDINSIAQSSPEELATSFSSAGLHWRWALLYSMAIEINTRFSGEIPQGFDDLVSLPGVSHYIASALRCFSFGYPDVLLDTNTVRIAGRIFGFPITDSSRRSGLLKRLIGELMTTEKCREFNFAQLDFAAKICRPKPIHNQCPIKEYCKFYNLNEFKHEGILQNG